MRIRLATWPTIRQHVIVVIIFPTKSLWIKKKLLHFNRCFDKIWYECDHFKRFVYIFHFAPYEWASLYLNVMIVCANFAFTNWFPNEFVWFTSMMERRSSKCQLPTEWWLRCHDTWDWQLFSAKTLYPSSRSLSPANKPLQIPMDVLHLWLRWPENQIFYL